MHEECTIIMVSYRVRTTTAILCMECRLHHDIRPVLDKYCVQDGKKEAKMISLDFELVMDPNPNQMYTAIVNEVKHGKFELKVVQYKPKDKIIGPARHDIVLPGRYISLCNYHYHFLNHDLPL